MDSSRDQNHSNWIISLAARLNISATAFVILLDVLSVIATLALFLIVVAIYRRYNLATPSDLERRLETSNAKDKTAVPMLPPPSKTLAKKSEATTPSQLDSPRQKRPSNYSLPRRLSSAISEKRLTQSRFVEEFGYLRFIGRSVRQDDLPALPKTAMLRQVERSSTPTTRLTANEKVRRYLSRDGTRKARPAPYPDRREENILSMPEAASTHYLLAPSPSQSTTASIVSSYFSDESSPPYRRSPSIYSLREFQNESSTSSPQGTLALSASSQLTLIAGRLKPVEDALSAAPATPHSLIPTSVSGRAYDRLSVETNEGGIAEFSFDSMDSIAIDGGGLRASCFDALQNRQSWRRSTSMISLSRSASDRVSLRNQFEEVIHDSSEIRLNPRPITKSKSWARRPEVVKPFSTPSYNGCKSLEAEIRQMEEYLKVEQEYCCERGWM